MIPMGKWGDHLRHSRPHVCPVCRGRGKVPAWFYDPPSGSTTPVTCRTCQSTGIVWEPVNHASDPAERRGDAGGPRSP